MAFNNATFTKCFSSLPHLDKKPVRGMSENVTLFSTVNGPDIVNGCSEFFTFLLVLYPISRLHTPISNVWPVFSHYFFIYLECTNSLFVCLFEIQIFTTARNVSNVLHSLMRP